MSPDPRAIRAIVEQAEEMKEEPPRPLTRQMPPADVFPVDALGKVLGTAARAIHDRVHAPLAICSQSVLATAALAVQAHADVELPMGHVRPASDFFVTVAETGARKSASDTEATWPIRKREQALCETRDSELPSYVNDKTAWEKARDEAGGLANKLPEHAARLAAILALVDDLGAPEISGNQGLALAEQYATEALRLFGVSRVNSDLRLAQRLLEWLLGTWPEPAISMPDIYQRSLNAIGDKATAAKLIAILEDHGWLVRIPEGAVVSGLRRRDAWRIVRGTSR